MTEADLESIFAEVGDIQSGKPKGGLAGRSDEVTFLYLYIGELGLLGFLRAEMTLRIFDTFESFEILDLEVKNVFFSVSCWFEQQVGPGGANDS